MKRLDEYKHIAFFLIICICVPEYFSPKNYFPELLNLSAAVFLRFFRKKNVVHRWFLYSYEPDIRFLSRTLDSLHPKTMNRKLRRSLVHGTTQTLCILKKMKNMEIETKLDYSYSLKVSWNNIFLSKGLRRNKESEKKKKTSIRPIVRNKPNLMIITIIYDVKEKIWGGD